MKPNESPGNVARSVLVCFFLSGAAGLVYQVAWSKALALIFGHTVYAITIVLAVFMGGLGAGSAWIGEWSERSARNRIALYAVLEILVALTGMVSLAGLAAVRVAYLKLAPNVGDAGVSLILFRVVGAAVVLFIPTFLMGGTFPVLVRGLTARSEQFAKRVSQLYWVNTLGAVVGALMAGFVLLPAVGLRRTIGVAAFLNVFAAIVAWRLSREFARASSVPESPTRPVSSQSISLSPSSRLAMVALAVTGFTSIGYEVAWTRLLVTTISGSTYAFTLMLATFLCGIVAGSALFQRFSARNRKFSLATLAWSQTGIAATAVLSLFSFRWIPELIPAILRATQESFAGLVLVQVVTSVLVMLPMAVLFGFGFPLALLLLRGDAVADDASAALIGRGYAVNTAGAILGALFVGFWLIPWLGSFRATVLIAAVNVLLAVALYLPEHTNRVRALVTAAFVFAAALALVCSPAFYQRSLLTMSAALYGNSYKGRLTLEEIAATTDIVFAEEGLNASVAVLRSDDYVGLRINGKVDASTGDARTQLLLGHLGAAFHPSPKRVLIIGFGSGMTAAAVAHYPEVQRIDCVEIEPAVIHAAAYFEKLNHRILEDTRLNLITDDARSVLLSSRNQYDLIISEPSNPWIAGVATLFTDEFYAAVRQRLTPGGMFVQWVQSYSLSPADLKMIVATLAPHFPELTLWHAEGPDLLLFAQTQQQSLQFDHLRSAWRDAGVRKDFESMDVRQPEGIVAYFLLGDAGVRKLAEGGEKNSDDRMLLEYHAPRTLLARGLSEANHEMIMKLRSGPLPANLEPSERRVTLEAGALTALNLDDTEVAKDFVESLKAEPDSAAKKVAEGRFALLKNVYGDAKASFAAALKLDPESADAAHWLATSEHRAGDEAQARSLLDEWINREPKSLPLLSDKMAFAVDRQDYGVALLAQLSRMNVLVTPPASEYCRLGAIQMKLSNLEKAEVALREGTAIEPYSYSCHLALGEIYREQRKYNEARKEFELVIRFFPDANPATYRSVAGMDLLLGDAKSAREMIRKGLRIFPGDEGLQAAAESR
jgi:spermidine synthase